MVELVDQGALSDHEIDTLVAQLAADILGMSEDPEEHEDIVNRLGDVLAGWETLPVFPTLVVDAPVEG